MKRLEIDLMANVAANDGNSDNDVRSIVAIRALAS